MKNKIKRAVANWLAVKFLGLPLIPPRSKWRDYSEKDILNWVIDNVKPSSQTFDVSLLADLMIQGAYQSAKECWESGWPLQSWGDYVSFRLKTVASFTHIYSHRRVGVKRIEHNLSPPDQVNPFNIAFVYYLNTDLQAGSGRDSVVTVQYRWDLMSGSFWPDPIIRWG